MSEPSISPQGGFEPHFCANCGAPVEGGHFCTRCGAPLRPAPPASAPTTTGVPPGTASAYAAPAEPAAAAPAPSTTAAVQPRVGWRSRRRWLVVAVVWIVLLGIGGLAGFAYGFFNGPGPGVTLPSDDEEAVIAEYGEPPAFVVADGPLGPGEDAARLEQWFYSDAGLIVVFLDGRKVSEDFFTPEGDYPPRSCSPADFTRSLRARDVEELLGEPGVPVPEVETAFDDYEAFAYQESGVVVGYLDGWFYTAQTY